MKIKLQNKNYIYYLVLAFITIISLIWLAHPLTITEPKVNELHQVVQVYDGDTIVILLDGKRESVRLIGIDTPEVDSPYTKEECYGPEASEFAKNLLLGQNVRLEFDQTGDNRDKYERLLCYVYLGDTDVNAQLLTKGYAYLLDAFPFTRSNEYRQLEQSARENSNGLWRECE